MVRPSIDQLKAAAFALSKILSTYHVKLSSQQCLDVLARLVSHGPYEALIAKRQSGTSAPSAPQGASSALSGWLDIAEEFCDLVSTLDRECVDLAAYPSLYFTKHTHWDRKSYLLAAGNAAACFARSARTFVEAQASLQPSSLLEDLLFSALLSEPIVDGKLATLRVQGFVPPEGNRLVFEDIIWNRSSEDLLFGTEARIELTTWTNLEKQLERGPHILMPGIQLTYEVCGQPELELFAHSLRSPEMSDLWSTMGPLEIATSILLTTSDGQKSIDDEWTWAEMGARERLIAFCERASMLTDEETCDWPPYLTLSRRLDRSNSERDLEDTFAVMCILVKSVQYSGVDWSEVLALVDQS